MSVHSLTAALPFAAPPQAATRLVRAAPIPLHRAMKDAGRPEKLDYLQLAMLVESVALRRDRAAFTSLYDHFAPRLKTFLMRLGASPTSAEELTQETMLTLWRKAESFDPRQANVSTWIFTIARNKRIDLLRREARPNFDPNDPCFVSDAEPAPDDTVAAAEHAELLGEAIGRLPSEQAELLRICYYGDKSHRQIAHDLGLPLGTVKSRLRLALARLRLALKDNGR